MVLIGKHASFCSFMFNQILIGYLLNVRAGNELNELDRLAVKE